MKLRNKLFGARARQLNYRILNEKPLLLVKIAQKYLWKVLFKKDSLRGISFATSYKCNFLCTHCYTQRFKDTEETPLTTFEKIAVIKECHQLGAVSFDFVGGEIGITDEFYELLPHCRLHMTHVSLASNGYEMTHSKVRQLKESGVDKISISIDSGSEEEHDRFRRKKGSFKRCFEALDSIRAEGLVPVIITTVSKGGTKRKEFWDLIKCAIYNRIQLVFSAAIPFGEWEGNLDVLCDEEDLETMRKLHEQHPLLTRDSYENLGSFGCPAAKQVLYISEYGDVMPCAFTHITFGNVKYESIRDIRNRMLKIPEFARYHPICLAGEDKYFISNHLSKNFGNKTYPVHAEQAFVGSPELRKQTNFTENINKIYRPCPLCGNNKTSFITAGREHEFVNTTHDLFCVVRCDSCDLVYLNSRPHEATLDIIYPESYYCHTEAFARTEASRTSVLVALKKPFIELLSSPRQIKKLMREFQENENNPLRVLDIGCGNGDALDTFIKVASKPIITTGLDYNSHALKLVARKGHKALKGKIEDVSLGENIYDIIYSSNVIEHIADPLSMLKKVFTSLKPGGIFYCETPNFDSLDAKLFVPSGHWGGLHFPRHWTFFTPKTLAQMAEKAGLKLEKVEYKPVPIFWIWTMHSYLYRGKGKRKAADRLFPLIENKSNFILSFINKSVFTFIDFLQMSLTRKTSLMAVYLRKSDHSSRNLKSSE